MEIKYDEIDFGLFKVTDDIKGNKYRNAIHDIPLMAMIDAYNVAEGEAKNKFDKAAMGKAVIAQMTDIFTANAFSKEESNQKAFNPTVTEETVKGARVMSTHIPEPETTPETTEQENAPEVTSDPIENQELETLSNEKTTPVEEPVKQGKKK